MVIWVCKGSKVLLTNQKNLRILKMWDFLVHSVALKYFFALKVYIKSPKLSISWTNLLVLVCEFPSLRDH